MIPRPGKKPSSLPSSRPEFSSGEHQGDRSKLIDNNKRRRNQLSCAECRRLKLRCDRVFPCESCRKRGCAAICPEGALTTKGTRFVLANTEEYHTKISDMSERIRQLENALAQLHTVTPHPLLRGDLLLVKVPIELSANVECPPRLPQPSYPGPEPARPRSDSTVPVLNASGTLKIGADGCSKYFGQTAQAEDDDSPQDEMRDSSYSLPPELQHMGHDFPSSSNTRDVTLVRHVLDKLPPKPEMDELVDIYFANAAWLYEPCPRPRFRETYAHVVDHIDDPKGINLHHLALVFAVLAHGALTDLRQKPYNSYSLQLHQLSRACLSLSPFIEEPSLSAVQALFLLGLFWTLSNKKEAANAGWLIQCLNAKLAQTLGLHRDLDYWDAEDNIAQGEARRKIFWELITLEGWMSLGLGRPSTLQFSGMQCKMPSETLHAMTAPDGRLHKWHTWKHGLAQFVNRVLQKSLSAKTPPYLEILELDRSIQGYKMPPDIIMMVNGTMPPPPGPEETPRLTMQRGILIQAHSTRLTPPAKVLLLLHRGFFARALEEETDPMQSRFSPSVLATYNSAWRVILALQNIYSLHPGLTCRFGMFWSNAFSSMISMCLLVTRATRSSYATSALEALNVVYDLFTSAAAECAPAAKALPVVTRLREKAHAAYEPYRHGHPASMTMHALPPDHEDEELKTLGGKTNIARLHVPTPPSLLKGYPLSEERTERRFSQSPSLRPPLPPTNHLENVHPLLLQYMAQSQWASDGQVPYAHSGAPIAHSQTAPVHHQPAQHHPESYPPPPHPPPQEQRQEQQRRVEYQHGQQDHRHSEYHQYAPYQHTPQPGYAAPVHYSHGGGVPGPQAREHLGQQYNHQGHPTHYSGYADPSLETYADQSDLHERNQYAAWQTHMEQLGLPF